MQGAFAFRKFFFGAIFWLLPALAPGGSGWIGLDPGDFSNTSTLPESGREGYFAFSPIAREAYENIISLRLGEARNSIAALRRKEPGNLIVDLLENYLDFVTVLVNDNRAEFRRLAKNMEPRLARIARGKRKSPWFLYAQAEIRLHWAVLRGRFGHYLGSLSDVKQAYALLEQNQREHPDFMANRKSLGVLHALVGNVPGEYRWSLKALAGMRGTIAQGMRELKEVAAYARQRDFVFEEENRAACAFLQLQLENNKPAAWETLSTTKLDPRQNPLAAFALANLAIRTGRNDEAIRLLENCPEGDAYHPFPYRYYLLGIAKLNRLDADAGQPLQLFIRHFKGENGVREAYQKLAWHQLIAGNKSGYETHMRQVRTKGGSRSEPDKAALREALSGETPDVLLIKARLLFDGGYYQRAFDLLQPAGENYKGPGKPALEYHYRLGRVADELGKTQDAIRLYTQTINAGARKPWYFACNAALQLGMLYERQGENVQARKAYRRCLDLQPEEYAASLHAKAKAGLNRVE